MVATPNLENANNGGFLWPPIADALDTFLRRRLRNAGPFERVWRLIHLWEATEITLALAAIALVKKDYAGSEILRRQREFFYGRSWDPVAETMRELQGAADGAIDQWINILDEVAKSDSLSGRFLPALQQLLKSSSIDVAPLVNAWAKTCDVPSDYQQRGVVEVRVAMRYLNSFRNRLAHVPFPHDPLSEVSDALEGATEQLFSIDPLPSSHEKDGQSNPLTGALRSGACFLRGSHFEAIASAEEDAGLLFVFPSQKKNNPDTWPAEAFVHIDPMMRPYVLTRVKGIDVCEYTRFRAEANAVLVVADAGIAKHLPAPEKAEYEPPAAAGEEVQVEETHSVGMPEALEAIRSGDFDVAISYFADLAAKRPTYHVGLLRLGHARREKAARLLDSDPSEAEKLLVDAIDSLSKASAHIDPAYKALSHYEKSKAFQRLARIHQENNEYRKSARSEALEACKLSDERKYQTWLEYLETYLPYLEA